jgi:hypothetical protein
MSAPSAHPKVQRQPVPIDVDLAYYIAMLGVTRVSCTLKSENRIDRNYAGKLKLAGLRLITLHGLIEGKCDAKM